jgi:hypothetical protein
MSANDDFSFAIGIGLADGALGVFFCAAVRLGLGAADTLTTSAAARIPTGHLRFEPGINFLNTFCILSTFLHSAIAGALCCMTFDF